MCVGKFFNTVNTIGASDTRLFPTSMEALDAFKVESVNVGLAKLNLVSNILSGFQITRINGAGQAIYRVIRHFDCFWNALECQNR